MGLQQTKNVYTLFVLCMFQSKQFKNINNYAIHYLQHIADNLQ